MCEDGETVLTFDGVEGDEWHEQNMTVSCGDNPVQVISVPIFQLQRNVGVDLHLYIDHCKIFEIRKGLDFGP